MERRRRGRCVSTLAHATCALRSGAQALRVSPRWRMIGAGGSKSACETLNGTPSVLLRRDGGGRYSGRIFPPRSTPFRLFQAPDEAKGPPTPRSLNIIGRHQRALVFVIDNYRIAAMRQLRMISVGPNYRKLNVFK